MRYVKICPQCGALNNEGADFCVADSVFLPGGSVPEPAATPAAVATAPAAHAPTPTPPPLPSADAPPVPPKGERATSAFRGALPMYLEPRGNRRPLAVFSGWVVGQGHADRAPDLALPADLPGIQYVHRRHCRFECRDAQWFVTLIDQRREFGSEVTHRTLLNGREILPGQTLPLRTADLLTLAELELVVRINR